MKRIFNFIYKCHKWFGLPLAVMFLMWYCSGIVMMYHGFPRLSATNAPVENVDHATLDSLWKEVPDRFSRCKVIFSGVKPLIITDTCTVGAYHPAQSDLNAIAGSFGTTAERVDTLHDIDKWTPFNNLVPLLPFYRIVGDDGSYTYVSSKTGEVVQHNTLSGRRWAWFGALPHYVYITPLRRDAGLWRTVVIWMSGLSTVSVIFGFVIAVRFLLKRKKLHVFRKRSWQLHYSWGLFFGVFMFAFIFSGMMSLAQIPDWIMRSRDLKEYPQKEILKSDVDLTRLPECFGQAVLRSDPQLMWVVNSERRVDVVGARPGKGVDFSCDFMTSIVERQTGERVTSVEKIDDDFYYHHDGITGYRATTEHFTAYWNERGYFRILDSKAKAQYVCYRFLHTMKIPGLYDVKWLHSVYMWVILLGGLVVVVSGTILSLHALRQRGSCSQSCKNLIK